MNKHRYFGKPHIFLGFYLYSQRLNEKGEVMKTFHKELWFNIPERMGFVNITPDVKTVVD